MLRESRVRGSDMPWITVDLREQMYKRDHLRRVAIRSKSPSNYQNYRVQRNKTRTCLRNAKKDYYDTIIRESANTPKSLWANIKQLLPKSTSIPTVSVMVGDEEVSDPLGIANAFNTFFTTVGSDLATQFANQADPPVIPSSGYESFKFKFITASEVMTLLSGLSISKAHGTDNIMARSLKVAANELSFPLATIYNFSLLTGTIPSEWKQAVVTPVFKEGDRQNTSNYRPISVLPLCMKMFERLIHDQLYAHVTKHNILNPFQSGVRSGHSTTTALLDVSDYLYDQRQHGNITGAIFLDLKKAFDTVDTNILLHKLSAIGIQKTELFWFRDYFTNRTQHVRFNEAASSVLPINFGVPQGSVLGPLLFTLYINDLPSVVKHSKVVLYADDTAFFVSGKCIENTQMQLNDDLETVSKWLNVNRLTLNANKTKTMLFGTQQHLSKREGGLKLNINGESLEQVSCFKYLGLWFDPSLNWKKHVDCISKKISQRIGVQSRIRPFISTTTANTLFKTMIAPIIDYGDIMWSKGPQSNLKRIQKLQNKACRVILRCRRRTHISTMHSSLGWLTSQNKIKLHKMLMVGKCLLGDVPSYLRGKFIRAKDFHSYSTRNANCNLFIPRITCNAGKNLFCYEGAVLFNTLNNTVKTSQSYKEFKDKCKTCFNHLI